MTEFPTLCALRYDRDEAERRRSVEGRSSAVLRLPPAARKPPPSRSRSRSRTHPEGRIKADQADSAAAAGDDGGLEFWGEDETKTPLTTPYRYSSSKSSSLRASKEDNTPSLQRDYSPIRVPALQPINQHHHHLHHRSLSEPPPKVTERAQTAPASALSLPALRQGGAGDTSLTVNAELLQDPVWSEYLSAWVSGNRVSSHAFVSFVGAMTLTDRGRYHYVREFEELPVLPCPRFFEHMHHVSAPKALWKEKKKTLKKPDFWTWKGRTPIKVPKPKPLRKRAQLSCCPATAEATPPPSVHSLSVDIPTCWPESDGRLTPSSTSDLYSLSISTPSPRAYSPARSPDEVLPEIQELSEPSDYGSIRSGIESLDMEPILAPVKLYQLENPPRPPSSVDWDVHSYLTGFGGASDDYDVSLDNEDGGVHDGLHKPDIGRWRRDVQTAGPLVPSQVDQTSYMYNDHIIVLEPLVYEHYLPINDLTDLMRSLIVEGCEEAVVGPYPLEGPLPPDVAGTDRVDIQRSAILPRPELPSPPAPPPPKEPTPPPPPHKEPTPPPKTPTPPPPPVAKPPKKHGKPKRPPKKERVKKKPTPKTPPKQATPQPELATPPPPPKTPAPPTPPPPDDTMDAIIFPLPRRPEPEPEQPAPSPEPVQPAVVVAPPPLPVVEVPAPEQEVEAAEEEPTFSPDPEEPECVAATPAPAMASPATPEPTPLPSSPTERDMSYAREMERQRLADERHRKALLMYDKLRARQPLPVAKMEEPEMGKEYGWLAKFCILKPERLKMYSLAFETVDEGRKGWLSCFDTLIALKGITGTQNLTEKEEEYICRILEIADYNVLEGSDFRIFSIMAGLSQKLSSIDAWVRNLIQKFDLQMLDWKIYKGRELFEWCIDESTNRLSVSRLLIELRAGGVSDEHLEEVRLKFGEDGTLDLIDFLTYLPLFVMTHESVVGNPLCDVRDK